MEGTVVHHLSYRNVTLA